MGVAVLVVQHGAALDGFLGNFKRDVGGAIFSGQRALHRQLECVEGVAGVAAGDVDQVLDGVFIKVDRSLTVAALGVVQSTFQDAAHVAVFQRAKLKNARARDQGADDLEVGVLGGGADEGEGAVLDMGQEGVLLSLVPAMDLVDEEDGLLLVEACVKNFWKWDPDPDIMGSGAYTGRFGNASTLRIRYMLDTINRWNV